MLYTQNSYNTVNQLYFNFKKHITSHAADFSRSRWIDASCYCCGSWGPGVGNSKGDLRSDFTLPLPGEHPACLLVCSDPVSKHSGRQGLIYSQLILPSSPRGWWRAEVFCLCMCVYSERAEDALKMGEERVVERLPGAWLLKTVLEKWGTQHLLLLVTRSGQQELL